MSFKRLSERELQDLRDFIDTTATAWRAASLIKNNSFGVEILVAHRAGSDFIGARPFRFGDTLSSAKHGMAWYADNAAGKNEICVKTGMDSFVAIRMCPGLVLGLHGAFPWGGAVIDQHYGVIVGTSGFEEDEDILFSCTVLNRVRVLMDREGALNLKDARIRGEQPGEAGADRFTKID